MNNKKAKTFSFGFFIYEIEIYLSLLKLKSRLYLTINNP